MQGIKKAAEAIKKAKDIAIGCHINPDGDAIGSLLALSLGLEKMGKRVFMLSQDGVPKRYRRLPGAGRIRKRSGKKVDLAISVDCNTKEMLGRAFSVFDNAKTTLQIDHHEFGRPFGDITLVDIHAAAVGEIVYDLLKKLHVEADSDIAQNILTSLIIETDSFRSPEVRPFTFELCGRMMEIGPDFHKLVNMVFWAKTKEMVVLSGLCLARSRFLKKGRIVWSIARIKDFLKCKGKDEDIDPTPDEMRAIEGIKIAVLFREKSKKILRVSLRSKEGINIARVAESFGGGGHFDTAGCVIPNTESARKQLLKRAEALLS